MGSHWRFRLHINAFKYDCVVYLFRDELHQTKKAA